MRLSPTEINILKAELTIRFERNLEEITKTDDLEFMVRLIRENKRITEILEELNN